MVRNINVYNKHVKKHTKEYNYMKALRALRECRNTNPARKDAFNSLISDLKKKNPHWGRKSIADYGSTTRALFKAVSFVTIIKQTVARFLSIY
jgi:hypothetical protein